MALHLLRCQGFAVTDYSVTLGRLEAAASSTFATSGYSVPSKSFHIKSGIFKSTIMWQSALNFGHRFKNKAIVLLFALIHTSNIKSNIAFRSLMIFFDKNRRSPYHFCFNLAP